MYEGKGKALQSSFSVAFKTKMIVVLQPLVEWKPYWTLNKIGLY